MEKREKQYVDPEQKAIRALPTPDSGYTRYYVDGCEYLAVEVLPSGRKTFKLIKRVGKSTTPVGLGRWSYDEKPGRLTLKQAQDKLKLKLADIVKGINPAEEVAKVKSAPTLQDVFNEYMAKPRRGKKKKARSPKTKKDYEWQFKKYLKPSFGDVRVPQITKKDVENWHNTITKEGGIYVGNRCLSLIKQLLNYAVDEEYLDRNPARKVEFNAEDPRDRPLTDDEIARFWKACRCEETGEYWRLCLLTGQRQQEVLTMKWKDIDDLDSDRPMWAIPEVKGGRKGTGYISTECAAMLKQRKQSATSDSDYVFPRIGNSNSPMPVNRHAWERITTAAGLVDEEGKAIVRPHDLRHTLAQLLVRDNTHPEVKALVLNHKTAVQGVTSRYGKPTEEMAWNAVNKANDKIMGIVKRKQEQEAA